MQAFRYFLGPAREMTGWIDREVRCEFCGARGPAFALSFATCSSLSEAKRASAHGCAACLAAGYFEFWHDTEIGLLTDLGLDGERPPRMSDASLLELRRTPRIVTWQQETWLTDCDDFMAYIGTWTPRDFAQRAPEGDARAMFLRMTRDRRLQKLWDDMDIRATDHDWPVTYYAFRCLHCDELRGYYDFP